MCFQCTMFSLTTTAVIVKRTKIGYEVRLNPFDLIHSEDGEQFGTKDAEEPIIVLTPHFAGMVDILAQSVSVVGKANFNPNMLVLRGASYSETDPPSKESDAIYIYQARGHFLIQREFVTDENVATAVGIGKGEIPQEAAGEPDMVPALDVANSLQSLVDQLAFIWNVRDSNHQPASSGAN